MASTLSTKLKKLQKRATTLRSRARALANRNAAAAAEQHVLAQLLFCRDAWASVLSGLGCHEEEGQEFEQAEQDEQPAAHSDAALEELASGVAPDPQRMAAALPLAGAITGITRSLHERVMALTPCQAAQQWTAHVHDARLLLMLHASDPGLAAPALSACAASAMAFMCCLYFFNPRVAYALQGMNLQTGERQAAPPGFWQQAAQALELSSQQAADVSTVTQLVQPQLEALEAEKQELLDQLAQLPTSAQQRGDDTQHSSSSGSGASAGAAGWSHEPAAALARPGGGSGADDASSSSSCWRLQQLEQAKQLTQALERNCRQWRVITSMRAHFTVMKLEPLQACQVICASAPFLLIGAPIFDALAAACDAQQGSR